MLELLKKLISVPSVMDEPEKEAPFGKEVRRALDVFLAEAKKIGLKTHDEHGYYGWAEYGEGEGMIGLACHIDVVPATGDWKYPPYELTQVGDKIYGRGVADDKGAIAVCLKLLEKFKNDGVKFKHRIRLIVGCNEENGSLCLKKYNEVDEKPTFTLVPDADFPIVNSEKGILHFTVSVPCGDLESAVVGFSGGKRPNIVPDEATVEIKKNAPLYGEIKSAFDSEEKARSLLLEANIKPHDFTIEDGETLKVTAHGIAGHAMAPQNGDNAIYKLLRLISSVSSDEFGSLKNFSSLVAFGDLRSNLAVYKSDPQSGELTINLGMVRFKDGKLLFTLDSRLPISANHEDVLAALPAFVKGCKVEEYTFSPNLYIDENDKIVKTLLSAYCAVTGDKPHCVQTGGGTYARSIMPAIAFGYTPEGRETNLHNANENFTVTELEQFYKIYELAIINLDKTL